MDFTKIKCISENCKDKNITMGGAGGNFGGRISTARVKCPNCDLVLLIMPMSDKYEYNISATTEEERIEERIKKAKEKSMKDFNEAAAKVFNKIDKIGELEQAYYASLGAAAEGAATSKEEKKA